ncbi:MAG TPA: LysM peptidoglycan-binding domain-containing protein [Opitutales bacterium]|nr:LysM peptidoglycan-binding domain-containing protein [Opitutales bacterium]
MKNQKFAGLLVAAHLTLGAALLLLAGCSTTPKAPKPAPKAGDNVPQAQGTPRPVNPAFNPDLQAPTRPSESVTPETATDNGPVLEPAAPAAVAPAQEYVVEKGDSLSRIAKKFGVSLAELRAANNLSSDTIKVGQKLVIPGAAPVSGSTSMAVEGGSAAPASGAQEYTVLKGDSLSRIATRFGVSVADLKAANGLTGDTIKAGQKLVLPANALATPKNVPAPAPERSVKASGLTYKVAKGDSLGSIAHRAGVKVQDLMDLNGISDPKKLRVGVTLKLPAGAKKISAAGSQHASKPAAGNHSDSAPNMLPTDVLGTSSTPSAQTPAPTSATPVPVKPGSAAPASSGASDLESLDGEPVAPTVPVQGESSNDQP